ncbi:hypothetical protein QQY66_02390 [Streptomyces sp. DG2A-72]|uniref:hypothetical protein n=1 Tax=Streptomyces sp. DG2A-72 TaxID=3051386 RepID=UPI00265C8279|nr:hypothetical protein [Streptomyces sp. DG2A-72]MDO0930588.1 hypothetical protein [Streptomyces sp. DG2A-72]
MRIRRLVRDFERRTTSAEAMVYWSMTTWSCMGEGVMARAIWAGLVTFGLVSAPVGLYSVTEEPVRQRAHRQGSPERGIVKGFEVTEVTRGVRPLEVLT